MRVLYENSATLENESSVASVLEKSWGCRAFKLPISFRVDYALTVEGMIKSWAEIKCRGKRYDDMHLSLHKWMAGVELSRRTGLPFVLVYAFNDGIVWRRVDTDQPELTIGGRTDRGDWQDTEPMATFQLKGFKTL